MATPYKPTKQALHGRAAQGQRVGGVAKRSEAKQGPPAPANDKPQWAPGREGVKQRRAQAEALHQERVLAKMTPEQRATALQQHDAAKQAKAGKAQQKANARLLSKTGIVGSKQERAAFKTQRAALVRERALARMTPAQRKDALKKEAAAQAAQSTREAAKAAKVQRAKDNKTLAKTGIVGSKEERAKFKTERAAIVRQRKLDAMPPKQRQAALKQEAAFKQAQADKEKKAAEAKTRKTVAVVGDEKTRGKFREDKKRLKREDQLAQLTPEQRSQAQANEEARRQAEARRAEQRAQQDEQRRLTEEKANANRTVARVRHAPDHTRVTTGEGIAPVIRNTPTKTVNGHQVMMRGITTAAVNAAALAVETAFA